MGRIEPLIARAYYGRIVNPTTTTRRGVLLVWRSYLESLSRLFVDGRELLESSEYFFRWDFIGVVLWLCSSLCRPCLLPSWSSWCEFLCDLTLSKDCFFGARLSDWSACGLFRVEPESSLLSLSSELSKTRLCFFCGGCVALFRGLSEEFSLSLLLSLPCSTTLSSTVLPSFGELERSLPCFSETRIS